MKILNKNIAMSEKTISTVVTTALLCLAAGYANAHTNSIGYVNSGPGAVTFWYGNWHEETNYNEGELKLEGVNGTSYAPQIVRFNLLQKTLPSGLISGTNYFSSDGSVLVPYDISPEAGDTYTWQGAKFLHLTAGTYRFTYIPLGDPQSYNPTATPTVDWEPMDPVILSSIINLDASLIGGGYQALVDQNTTGSKPASGLAKTLDDLSNSQNIPTQLQNILDQINSLSTDKEKADAIASLLPVLSVGNVQALLQQAQTGPTKIVIDRMFRLNGLSSGDETLQDRKAWVKPFGSLTKQNDRDGIRGYESNGYGLVLGADAKINPTWRIGAAASYAQNDITGNGSSNSVDATTVQLTGYATKRINDSMDLNLLLAGGYTWNSSQRTIQVGVINSMSTANYDSNHFYTEADLTKTYKISDTFTLMPSARISYTKAHVQGYQEEGSGPANLNVGATSAESLVSMIGAKAVKDIGRGFKLSAHADIGYDALAKQGQVTASFTEGGNAFVVKGMSPAREVYRGGVALEWVNKSGMEVTAAYDTEQRTGYNDQTVYVNFRWMF
ncbi:autotransporter outer membrane beta-barrel domain-containing protein [Vogesella sp. LIG4]|uniref:autotransporter outer membrane beta-barrel domain-containing protein n=1 Tax=Vogesella sp. LIG4 TaxID=1192162 RepID=UPI00081F9CF6|nr:autotransporter outer membrane beta-barrel domain-containing protein [Vogesella sp. LIG4]SCK26012.1 Autotransporter beta-domain-containing protein [Vogesella sp. LIG4]